MRDLEPPDKSTYIKHRGKLDFISCNEPLSVLELENEGTKLLVKSIQLVRKKYRHPLDVDGILMNMVVERMILTREMLEETKRDFGEAVKVYQVSRRH